MKDTFEETTQSERLHALPTSIDELTMSTEKVGCILVTSHLKQFLEDYPSSSEKQVFLDISFLRHISHAIIVRQIFV